MASDHFSVGCFTSSSDGSNSSVPRIPARRSIAALSISAQTRTWPLLPLQGSDHYRELFLLSGETNVGVALASFATSCREPVCDNRCQPFPGRFQLAANAHRFTFQFRAVQDHERLAGFYLPAMSHCRFADHRVIRSENVVPARRLQFAAGFDP